MIKLTFCLRRLPHLSREEFQVYWREKHAPLVAKHAEVLGILRYVQNHTSH
ncbi:MAG TPA: EthD family reductase, partial [Hyphomonas atlantica]|nr:EthD family reductase [Hyphomonas atlantica]